MIDKRHTKDDTEKDRPQEDDPKLGAEVVADLDVPEEDGEALRGGYSNSPGCRQF